MLVFTCSHRYERETASSYNFPRLTYEGEFSDWVLAILIIGSQEVVAVSLFPVDFTLKYQLRAEVRELGRLRI